MSHRKLHIAFWLGCLLFGCVLQPQANAAVCNTASEQAMAGNWFRLLNSAWEHLDAAAATVLFTKTAEYRDDPFGPSQRGARAIHAYWEGVAHGQRDVHTNYEVLSVCGNTSIVHWTANFVRMPSGQKVRLDGIAEVTLNESGKAVAFREWWDREQK